MNDNICVIVKDDVGWVIMHQYLRAVMVKGNQNCPLCYCPLCYQSKSNSVDEYGNKVDILVCQLLIHLILCL